MVSNRITSGVLRFGAACFTVFAALVSLAGCTPSFGEDLNQSSMSNGLLDVTPATGTIAAGQVIQLHVAGGRAPYTFIIASGSGTVNSNGVFIAPMAVSANQTQISIEVTDSIGSQGYVTFYMNPAAIATAAATYSPNPAYAGQSITITPTSGSAPYTYTLVSGSGILSGNVYQAASAAETAQILVRDANGISSTLSIPITSLNVLTYLAVSAPGQHVPGGGGCAANTAQVGSVADADSRRIYGDQIFCGAVNPKEAAAQVITDIVVTQGGQHVNGGLSCPAGYTTSGTISDCQGGVCGGSQNICTRIEAPSSLSSNPVLDFYVTPSNVHDTMSSPSPRCNDGYVSVGFAADCGFGRCEGLQTFCMKK